MTIPSFSPVASTEVSVWYFFFVQLNEYDWSKPKTGQLEHKTSFSFNRNKRLYELTMPFVARKNLGPIEEFEIRWRIGEVHTADHGVDAQPTMHEGQGVVDEWSVWGKRKYEMAWKIKMLKSVISKSRCWNVCWKKGSQKLAEAKYAE